MNLVVNARDAMPNGGRLASRPRMSRIGLASKPGSFARRLYPAGGDRHRYRHGRKPSPHLRTLLHHQSRRPRHRLGLATVYGIMKQNNGWIEVQSTLGRGSSFQIFLPAEAQAAADRRTRQGRPAEPAFAGETILVVEDAAALRDLVCQALSVSGCTVLSAPEAQEALRILSQQKGAIHLLITDSSCPE